jgi:hypothetical protein
MVRADVQVVERCDVPFDLDIGGHRLPVDVGEMVIHGEVVVNGSDADGVVKDLTLVDWLLYEPLHDRPPGTLCPLFRQHVMPR